MPAYKIVSENIVYAKDFDEAWAKFSFIQDRDEFRWDIYEVKDLD